MNPVLKLFRWMGWKLNLPIDPVYRIFFEIDTISNDPKVALETSFQKFTQKGKSDKNFAAALAEYVLDKFNLKTLKKGSPSYGIVEDLMASSRTFLARAWPGLSKDLRKEATEMAYAGNTTANQEARQFLATRPLEGDPPRLLATISANHVPKEVGGRDLTSLAQEALRAYYPNGLTSDDKASIERAMSQYRVQLTSTTEGPLSDERKSWMREQLQVYAIKKEIEKGQGLEKYYKILRDTSPANAENCEILGAALATYMLRDKPLDESNALYNSRMHNLGAVSTSFLDRAWSELSDSQKRSIALTAYCSSHSTSEEVRKYLMDKVKPNPIEILVEMSKDHKLGDKGGKDLTEVFKEVLQKYYPKGLSDQDKQDLSKALDDAIVSPNKQTALRVQISQYPNRMGASVRNSAPTIGRLPPHRSSVASHKRVPRNVLLKNRGKSR